MPTRAGTRHGGPIDQARQLPPPSGLPQALNHSGWENDYIRGAGPPFQGLKSPYLEFVPYRTLAYETPIVSIQST